MILNRTQRFTLIVSVLFSLMIALVMTGLDVGFFLAILITIGLLAITTIFWIGFFTLIEWAERG